MIAIFKFNISELLEITPASLNKSSIAIFFYNWIGVSLILGSDLANLFWSLKYEFIGVIESFSSFYPKSSFIYFELTIYERILNVLPVIFNFNFLIYSSVDSFLSRSSLRGYTSTPNPPFLNIFDNLIANSSSFDLPDICLNYLP